MEEHAEKKKTPANMVRENHGITRDPTRQHQGSTKDTSMSEHQQHKFTMILGITYLLTYVLTYLLTLARLLHAVENPNR